MTSSRLALPLACGASFIAFLDVTITNLAIPDLARDFTGQDVVSLSWVVTLYTVVFAALLTPAGRMADVIGRRSLFLVGVSVFTAMSLMAALAPNLPVLLVARAFQGAGASAMIPASLAFVLADTPPERRAASIGLWSASSALAAAVGPALGGVLVDAFGWGSLFMINVPVGLTMLAATYALPRAGRQRGRVPDLVGTVGLGAGVALAALGVTQSAEWGWDDPWIIGALILAVLLVGAVLRRSRNHRAPAIETSLWRSRTFALANVASLFYGASLYAWLLLGVLYLTQVWDYSELAAGLAMTPGAVVASAVGLSVSRLPRKPSPRSLVVFGAVVMVGTGLWLATALPTEPRFASFWLPIGMIAGLGIGAVSVGVSSAGALSVPPTRFAGATGLNLTARQVGGALGIAALATILPATAAGSIARFEHVYLFCALAAAGVALAGLGLILPSAAPVPEPKPEPAPQVGAQV